MPTAPIDPIDTIRSIARAARRVETAPKPASSPSPTDKGTTRA